MVSLIFLVLEKVFGLSRSRGRTDLAPRCSLCRVFLS
ncbi:hypothetical protein RAE06_09575 [Corynebacterium tuberculostearicum]|nr:hypothetical protein [Corynebacterium tuberculostearicum]MDV2429135.1 hypothetical protein [Corynebacterium tuberculostearicum]